MSIVRRPGFLVLSASSTLYVCTPIDDGLYRVRRCRVLGRPEAGGGGQVRELRGVVATVRSARRGSTLRAAVCGDHLFSVMEEGAPGLWSTLADEERADLALAVGGRWQAMSAGAEKMLDLAEGEVSTPIAGVKEIPVERLWTAEPMVRAYRNGDRSFANMLVEKPWERGNEHIEDESGVLAARALDVYYHRRLLAAARRRRPLRGPQPRIVTVSNEDLADALLGAACGPVGSGHALAARAKDVIEPRGRELRAHGEAVLASADTLLASYDLVPATVFPTVVNTTNRNLEAALLAATGEGFEELSLPLPETVRHLRGRIAAGLDQMLAAHKRFIDRPAPRPAAQLARAA